MALASRPIRESLFQERARRPKPAATFQCCGTDHAVTEFRVFDLIHG